LKPKHIATTLCACFRQEEILLKGVILISSFLPTGKVGVFLLDIMSCVAADPISRMAYFLIFAIVGIAVDVIVIGLAVVDL
jgi:hypothetical protein